MHNSPGNAPRRAVLAMALLATMQTSEAQDGFAARNNSIRLEYQYYHTGTLDTNAGGFDIGETVTHVFLLSGTYWVNDRWQLFGSIPYVQKQHYGNGAHDFSEFVQYTPPDLTFIDDGNYHGGFQDFFVGASYLAIDGAFSLSPFISYGFPMSDYPIYGNAVIGRDVWNIPVGVSMDYTPYFSDWYFYGDVAYVFSEEVVGVNLDYWLLYASASYFVTPRFAPRLFVAAREAPHGTTFPEDFTDQFGNDFFDDEFGYNHDRTFKHSYVNAGIGFDYILSDRYQISGSYFKTINPDNVAEVDDAFTIALTHIF